MAGAAAARRRGGVATADECVPLTAAVRMLDLSPHSGARDDSPSCSEGSWPDDDCDGFPSGCSVARSPSASSMSTASSGGKTRRRRSKRLSISDLSESARMTPEQLRARGAGLPWLRARKLCSLDLERPDDADEAEDARQFCLVPTPELKARASTSSGAGIQAASHGATAVDSAAGVVGCSSPATLQRRLEARFQEAELEEDSGLQAEYSPRPRSRGSSAWGGSRASNDSHHSASCSSHSSFPASIVERQELPGSPAGRQSLAPEPLPAVAVLPQPPAMVVASPASLRATLPPPPPRSALPSPSQAPPPLKRPRGQHVEKLQRQLLQQLEQQRPSAPAAAPGAMWHTSGHPQGLAARPAVLA